MTIKQALDVSNRTVSYREAEVLLGHVLKKERAWLLAHPEIALTSTQKETYEICLNRREKNEPVAHITGHKEFYGLDFKIDGRALIPRPETESLIEIALKWGETFKTPELVRGDKTVQCDKTYNILELGTGCGNIAVTLAYHLHKKKVPYDIIATDIAPEALELARENASELIGWSSQNPQHLDFIEADLFAHPKIESEKPYDLIIANLPYVPDTWKMHTDAQTDVIFYEPDIALFGGPDGLDIYRNFFKNLDQYLAVTSKVIIEFSEDHGDKIEELARKHLPKATITRHKDYADLDRVLEITAPR